VNAEGENSRSRTAHPWQHPAVAAEMAERLNDDEAQREEDKWSA
jgi:hypothetical protein